MKNEIFEQNQYNGKFAFLIFFLFLFLFAICFDFLFGLFLFDKKRNSHPVNLSFDVEKIKTPCREISIKDKAASKKLKASERIHQLTKLMDSPIDWVFKDIHGHVIDLYCLREKKIVVINFWATWCPPCIEELPSLSHLAEDHKDKISVLALSTEPLEVITSFLKQSFSDLSPHLKIARVSAEDKSQNFPEDSLPVTYIFNKKGLLKLKELGAKDWSNKNIVQQIINLP